jgi:hypothetical protein
MPKERTVSKHIIDLLEKHKGKGLRFRDFFVTFAKQGTFHNQSNIWSNLLRLLDEGKIIKVKGDTRNFYGIPLTRNNGTKYLIINQGIEPEEVELQE